VNNIRPDQINSVGRCVLDSSVSGQGSMAGSYKHDDESSGSVKGGKFFD